MRCAAFLREG